MPRSEYIPGIRAVTRLMLVVLGCFAVNSSPLMAQSRCVAPHGVAVEQIRGQVFDAFGIAVPAATVTILGIHGAVQTTADDTGQFSFDVGPGHYVFKAEGEGFAYSSAELKVGQTWRTIFLRPSLKVMLGFADTYCPWVTTSRKALRDAAEANWKRLKESARIKETSQTEDTSKGKETPQTKKKTKETSQTYATQK